MEVVLEVFWWIQRQLDLLTLIGFGLTFLVMVLAGIGALFGKLRG